MKKLFETPEAEILRLSVRDKMMVDDVSEVTEPFEGEEDEF